MFVFGVYADHMAICNMIYHLFRDSSPRASLSTHVSDDFISGFCADSGGYHAIFVFVFDHASAAVFARMVLGLLDNQ